MNVALCPHCRNRLSLPDVASDRQVSCPTCRQVFSIRARPHAVAAPPLPPNGMRTASPLDFSQPRPTGTGTISVPLLVSIIAVFAGIALTLVLVCVLLLRSGPADEPEQPVRPAVVDAKDKPPPQDQAKGGPTQTESKLTLPLDALGPMEKLNRIKAVQIRGKASFVHTPNVNNFTVAWESLRRFLFRENFGNGNETGILIENDQGGISGNNKGLVWRTLGGPIPQTTSKAMGPAEMANFQTFLYALSLSDLLPLQTGKWTLAKGQDAFIQGRPCFEIIARSEGKADISLSFDRDTRLLTKLKFKGKLWSANGLEQMKQETLLEWYYSDYKEQEGIKHWRRCEQHRNGKKYAMLVLDEVRIFKTIPDNLFASPVNK